MGRKGRSRKIQPKAAGHPGRYPKAGLPVSIRGDRERPVLAIVSGTSSGYTCLRLTGRTPGSSFRKGDGLLVRSEPLDAEGTHLRLVAVEFLHIEEEHQYQLLELLTSGRQARTSSRPQPEGEIS